MRSKVNFKSSEERITLAMSINTDEDRISGHPGLFHSRILVMRVGFVDRLFVNIDAYSHKPTPTDLKLGSMIRE